MATLVKIDKNGSKHYEGMVECDRCQGRGWYAVGVNNGILVPSHVDNAVCYKCHGAGKVFSKWIERTPEYQAILDAKRAEREAKRQAELEAEQAKINAEIEEQERIEAERKAKEEAEIKAQKAISQYIGQVGDKIDTTATYIKTAWFDVPSFRGFGMDTMYIHTFKIGDDVAIWKTSTNNMGKFDEHDRWIGFEEGQQIHLKGTIKDHNTYKDEKQTVLTRCRVKA